MDVLITGAARGIGAESARRLAARGARVALVGLEPAELERVSAECPGSIWVEADVTDEASLSAAVDRAVAEFGGLDAVMVNAGISAAGFVHQMPEGVGERIIEVNLIGALRTARLCAPHLIERRGYLLLIASLTALVKMPGLAPYAASKAGVEALADALRPELAHHGVDVGVGYFTWIDTDMVRGARRDALWGDMLARVKPPFRKSFPASAAADEVVRGIERRARNVMVPRWLIAVKALRSAVPPIAEREFKKFVPEFEARARADIERRGAHAVSAPIGAGGQADREAEGT